MKKKHIKKGFIEAGMIDEETGMVPVFEKLMGTCKSWVSNSKKIGISTYLVIREVLFARATFEATAEKKCCSGDFV